MKRNVVVGLAIAAAAALTISAGIVFLTASRQPDLRATAEDYLTALAAGDYAAIDSLQGSESAFDVTAQNAFEGAQEYVSDVAVESVSNDDATTGSARASIALAGERHTITVGFTLVNGRWLLAGGDLGSLTVTTALGDSVRIGGALVRTTEQVHLLPALYSVAAAPAGLLEGDAEVAVTDEPVAVTLDARLTSDASAQTQTQLDAYADLCTETATAVPVNCGIRVPWAADLTNADRIAFRIEKYPVASIAEDATTFAATGGVLVATVTGTSRAGGTASFTYRADDWALRGTVTFTGDELVLAVG